MNSFKSKGGVDEASHHRLSASGRQSQIKEFKVLIEDDEMNEQKNSNFKSKEASNALSRQTELNPLFQNLKDYRCCCCISMKRGINLIGVFLMLDFIFIVFRATHWYE